MENVDFDINTPYMQVFFSLLHISGDVVKYVKCYRLYSSQYLSKTEDFCNRHTVCNVGNEILILFLLFYSARQKQNNTLTFSSLE